MITSPRRALSVILAAALLAGAVPQGAQAQVARVIASEASAVKAVPAAGPAMSVNAVPVLSLGAASLTPSLSAPILSPALAAQTAAASAVSINVAAASTNEAPKLPDAPRAAAPAAKKTWTERIGAMLGRSSKTTTTQEAPAETAKTESDSTFDGSTEKQALNEGTPVSAGDIKITHRSFASRFSVSAAHEKRKLHIDEFGGPIAEPMTFKARAAYGLRQGLNLVGIGAILNATLRPFLDLFPWPQYLSDAALRGLGRVALLTKYGPNEIVTGLADSPLHFLGVTLPFAVTMEEITYRLFGFGLIFLALAAVKPVTRWLSTMLEGLPDAAGVVGGAKRLLKAGDWLSHLAFPLAAALSSVNFAMAHFASWGFSPFVLVLNLVSGLFLARTAYKSRGLTAPILAHLVFNLVSIGAIAIGLLVSPYAGAAFAIVAGLLGVSSLLHAWLTARKEKAFRAANGGKAIAALLIAALSFSALNVPSPSAVEARDAAARTAITQVQDTTARALPPEILEALAGAPAAPVESREAMVARVKGSVVNVIVRMPQGMGTGSGFILTPEGVFVTNGHVVGSRRPGQFVEARVPGVPGLLKAKVLAVNHDKDLAIVQLAPRPDGKPWPVVTLATRAPLEGEDVTATGYPRGLPFTVTAGVISGMDGRGNMYVRHLQTDASINPGNSGGPLFNARGEVVGVNTQIYTQSGGSDGLGFSIMAPEVARVMAQYAKTGNIATASLGIIANLSDPSAPDAGLEIEYVRHGSAAEKAGLRRGDLIIGVGGATIAEGGQEAAGHVAAALSKMIPGQTTVIVVLRGDSPVEIKLTADAKVTTAPSH